jgi:putative transcriptional regulator
MIQCRLRELMAAKTRLTRRKITYSVIKEETGLSKTTLVRLGNDRADLIGTSTMDRLCAFFDCQPGDLFVYLPSPNRSDVSSGV